MRVAAIVLGVTLGTPAMLLVAPAAAHAQSLDARINGAPGDAPVQFSFATHEGVCGDGAGLIARRGNGDDKISFMQTNEDGGTSFNYSSRSASKADMLRNCVPGPAHITLTRSDGEVTRIRMSVAGKPRAGVQDLGDVAPAEAARYLLDIATRVPRNSANGTTRISSNGSRTTSRNASGAYSSNAMFAASLADAQADVATGLLAITRNTSVQRSVRSDAIYWLGQTGDARAMPRFKSILADNGEDAEVRKSAIFAISQQKSPETLDILLHTARTDNDKEMRTSAIFWLGQMAADKATAGLSSILGDDSQEIEVRNAAIFAVSQQKTTQSVDLLMNVAKTSKEPELRRTAMYWLGQHADDPRVLKMFEDILVNK